MGRRQEDELQTIRHESEKTLSQLSERFKAAIGSKQLDKQKFEIAFEQLDKELAKDTELKNDSLNSSLKAQRDINLELANANAKLRRETIRFNEKKSALENLIQEGERQNQALSLEIARFEEKSQEVAAHLASQEKAINSQELELRDHRSRNEYLESNKKVFDYLVSAMQEENFKVKDYFAGLGQSLKVVRKQLTEEAEASKKLIMQHELLKKRVASMKTQISSARVFELRCQTSLDQCCVKMSQVLEDFSLDDGKLRLQTAKIFDDFIEVILQGNVAEQPLLKQAQGVDACKEEVERLGRLFCEKKKSAMHSLEKVRLTGDGCLFDYQEEGRELIQNCLEYRNKRSKKIAQILDQKQKVDALVKELSFMNMRILRPPKSAKNDKDTDKKVLPIKIYREQARPKQPPPAENQNQNKLQLTSDNLINAAIKDYRQKISVKFKLAQI